MLMMFLAAHAEIYLGSKWIESGPPKKIIIDAALFFFAGNIYEQPIISNK